VANAQSQSGQNSTDSAATTWQKQNEHTWIFAASTTNPVQHSSRRRSRHTMNLFILTTADLDELWIAYMDTIEAIPDNDTPYLVVA